MQNAVKKDPALDRLPVRLPADKGRQRRRLNGTGCNVANVTSGAYPGTPDFYEVTKGKANGARSSASSTGSRTRGGRRNHRDQVDPAQPESRRRVRQEASSAGACASHGPTAAPSARSARSLPGRGRDRGDGRVRRACAPGRRSSTTGVAGSGRAASLDAQVERAWSTRPRIPPASAYHLRAWPLIYGTLLTSVFAVLLGLAVSVLAAIFIVDSRPAPVRRVMTPVIRLLASVPSVVYGLIGVLVLVPFVGNDLITPGEKESVINVIQLTGAGLLRVGRDPDGDDHADHDRADHRGAGVGAALLARGRDRARAEPAARDAAVSLRAIRPAIIAAAALATARAIGEAIMISMVSGGNAFTPQPSRRADLHLRAAAHASPPRSSTSPRT